MSTPSTPLLRFLTITLIISFSLVHVPTAIAWPLTVDIEQNIAQIPSIAKLVNIVGIAIQAYTAQQTIRSLVAEHTNTIKSITGHAQDILTMRSIAINIKLFPDEWFGGHLNPSIWANWSDGAKFGATIPDKQSLKTGFWTAYYNLYRWSYTTAPDQQDTPPNPDDLPSRPRNIPAAQWSSQYNWNAGDGTYEFAPSVLALIERIEAQQELLRSYSQLQTLQVASSRAQQRENDKIINLFQKVSSSELPGTEPETLTTMDLEDNIRTMLYFALDDSKRKTTMNITDAEIQALQRITTLDLSAGSYLQIPSFISSLAAHSRTEAAGVLNSYYR